MYILVTCIKTGKKEECARNLIGPVRGLWFRETVSFDFETLSTGMRYCALLVTLLTVMNLCPSKFVIC